MIMQVLSKLAADRRRRTALLQLRVLDNHLLLDVGLTRDDLNTALRQPRRK